MSTVTAEARSAAATGERVLLVDDTPTNLQVLFQTLDGRGLELLVAQSGEEALEIAREARPTLVLLDIMMPGIDGYETCRRIRADPELAETAVIFMSALDDTKDKVRGLDLGAVDYITKPFQAEEVIARVNTHLTVQRLQRDLAQRNRELADANRRMKKDLDQAAKVQQAMLPTTAPECDGFRFAWDYRPCDELAGDSLNLFRIDERYIGLYILDVSGHGVQAALLSVAVSNALSQRGGGSLITEPADNPEGLAIVPPVEVALRLNEMYPMTANAGRYFTIAYAVLDEETGTLRMVCAGHPGPAVLRADGGLDLMELPSFPVGITPQATYEETVIELARGDRVCFFSDGLIEEMGPDGELFGEDRFRASLEASRDQPLREAIELIIARTEAWTGNGQLGDDVSFLALERV